MGAVRGFFRNIPELLKGVPTLGEDSYRADCPHCTGQDRNSDCDHAGGYSCGLPDCEGTDPGFDDEHHPARTGAGTKISYSSDDGKGG